MEVYYCLSCFNRFAKETAASVRCPKCEHPFVYWHTSPYRSEVQTLPKEILDELNKESYDITNTGISQ